MPNVIQYFGRMDNTDKDHQYVTALTRGLQILRCFTYDRPELSARKLVTMTGLPQLTVWRLCYTLEREGFLVCAGDNNKMALGLPALALGYAALVRAEMPKVALPYMQSLTERYRMSASLSVRAGPWQLHRLVGRAWWLMTLRNDSASCTVNSMLSPCPFAPQKAEKSTVFRLRAELRLAP